MSTNVRIFSWFTLSLHRYYKRFMIMNAWKKLIPDMVAVVMFAVISFVYFCPAVPEGRILSQHDSVAGIGAGQEHS